MQTAGRLMTTQTDILISRTSYETVIDIGGKINLILCSTTGYLSCFFLIANIETKPVCRSDCRLCIYGNESIPENTPTRWAS